MLTITEAALDAIRLLVEQNDVEGIRISTSDYSFNGSGPALQLEPVPGPEAGDRVLDADGAKVFLAPTAAALGDKVLDAEVGDDGVRFELHERE
jgi:iron-sulfur cluster assembly protein